MGGESKQTQTSSSTTAPWEAAQPAIKGILDQLQPQIANSGLSGASMQAINQLEQNAQQGNPFASQITGLTQNLLNGGGANAQAGNISNNLSTLQSQLTPFASGSMVGNNPALKAQLDTLMSDITGSVNGSFAAAGRTGSPMNAQTLARGFAQGAAPVLASQFNTDVQRQMDAANTLFNGGNATAGLLSGLNQQGLANQQQGVAGTADAIAAQNFAPTQTLNLEQLKQQIPAQNLGLLAQIGIPIAGLGSQSTGTATGTNQMSGAQQFGMIANGIGNISKFLFG